MPGPYPFFFNGVDIEIFQSFLGDYNVQPSFATTAIRKELSKL